MPSLCIYLQVHQPFRIKKYDSSKIGRDFSYFNCKDRSDLNNKKIFLRVAEKSYLPTNKLLLELLKRHEDFKLSLSISGVALEQMEKYSPQTLESFKEICRTGKVEILSETYYHSLAFFYSLKEFEEQVNMHREKIEKIFGVRPKVFRNTELAYTNVLAQWADKNGYLGILTEGWGKYLNGKSPNYIFDPKNTKNIKILFKNYELSDDIAFRFSETRWSGWPLTAKKFTEKVMASEGDTVNLFMDYETFGEHQWKETGIFDFLAKLPNEIIRAGNSFKTVSDVIREFKSKGSIDVPKILTWADNERDLSAWVGNKSQKLAIKNLYEMEQQIINLNNKQITDIWRKLQTSDHFYYMSTKCANDGEIHSYFSPYSCPNDAYECFMNTLSDLKIRISASSSQNKIASKASLMQIAPQTA